MKKKAFQWVILLAVMCCFSAFQLRSGTLTAKASTVATVNQITIIQKPTKTTYLSGENLDLSGLVVQASYNDGTSSPVTDYTVQGYDANRTGVQTVTVNYQNYSAAFEVTVNPGATNLPAKVTNVTAVNPATTSITLSWDVLPNVTRYDVYALDPATSTYVLKTSVSANSVTFQYSGATMQSFQICGVNVQVGTEYAGPFSDPYTAATSPEAVKNLKVTETTSSTVALSWSAVAGADGYMIYREKVGDKEFAYVKATKETTFTDRNLLVGQGYRYKVCAYVFNETFYGAASPVVDTSTKLAKMILKAKPGDQKIRISWSVYTGATSYDLYMKEEDGSFALLKTISNKKTSSYIADGLTTDLTYSFYAVAHRTYKGAVYDSEPSDPIHVQLTKIMDTSTNALLFPTQARFQKSSAYKSIPYFHKNVNFQKSIPIPGLITTNVGGFSSTHMCPQGIAFTDNYLLVTSYDLAGEENSVIYVLDRNSRMLLTTLVLPSRVHAGGICYDGVNVWITTGKSLAAIPYAQVSELAQQGDAYAQVHYSQTCYLGITASYVTYYDEKLWVGSYNELRTTKMNSYSIEDKEGDPALTIEETVKMPTRVQGVAFTKSGYLIMSRSCQTRFGRRGYMRELALYKPDLTAVSENSTIALGKCINSVAMPSMTEGIDICGSDVYVIFESAAFKEATYKMDHICSFKGSSLFQKAAAVAAK
jgi:fibronectin type 3 domain-containing protein